MSYGREVGPAIEETLGCLFWFFLVLALLTIAALFILVNQ